MAGFGTSPAHSSAKAEIQNGTHSCVVVKNGAIVHRDSGRGVAPLLRLYQSGAGRETLAGAEVADKIIGKGAAMILHLAGVAAVYGQTMSAAAADYLTGVGIPFAFGKLVPVLQNRTGDGTCPIEASVLEEKDPQKGYENILATINVLMQGP